MVDLALELDCAAGSLAFGAAHGRAKSNIGPNVGGFEYTLQVAPVPSHVLHVQRIDWGQPPDGTARELVAVEKPDHSPSAVDETEAFLREALRNRPVATKEAAESHQRPQRPNGVRSLTALPP